MYVNTKIAEKYQEFFNFMSQEHNLLLSISEMLEIVNEAQKLAKKLAEPEDSGMVSSDKNKAVVVYGKRDNQLCFFKIYDYETEEDKAKQKFIELMEDVSVDEYRMMTIETFSEVLEEGCRALD